MFKLENIRLIKKKVKLQKSLIIIKRKQFSTTIIVMLLKSRKKYTKGVFRNLKNKKIENPPIFEWLSCNFAKERIYKEILRTGIQVVPINTTCYD